MDTMSLPDVVLGEPLRQTAERDPVPDTQDSRLQLLARLETELRAPLHALLGGVQLMRMEAGLTASQSLRLDIMTTASTNLVEKISAILGVPGDETSRFMPDIGLDGSADAASGDRAPDRAPRPLRILVADDVAMNREIAAIFLRAAGHVVSVVDSGADAYVACSEHSFDAVLLDVRMPGMDGLETTRRIRTLPGPDGQVPIVAMTALAGGDEVEDCRKAGMNGHLAKPFRQDTLIDAVTRAAAANPALAGRGATSSAGPAELSASPGVASQLRKLVVERDRLKSEGAGKLPAAWIDIDSLWKPQTRPALSNGASAGPVKADDRSTLKLRDVGVRNGRRRLVSANLSCIPPQDRDQHEFHWLLFVGALSGNAKSFTGDCDLWRWSRSGWYSITAPGAIFDPEEMFEQGWRYCGPCVDQKVSVEIT